MVAGLGGQSPVRNVEVRGADPKNSTGLAIVLAQVPVAVEGEKKKTETKIKVTWGGKG